MAGAHATILLRLLLTAGHRTGRRLVSALSGPATHTGSSRPGPADAPHRPSEEGQDLAVFLRPVWRDL